jgi:ribonuclease VapC
VNVFDSSALLAFLRGESGADLVEDALSDGGVCGAANWSEVAQQIRSHGKEWATASALLRSYELAVEPVTAADAEMAASLWSAGSGLSLGDRLCLALGRRLEGTVWTADREWGDQGAVRQIR